MPDYSKCVMYKLVCKDKDIKDCYIGSTCNHSRRKSQHKNCCNNEKSKGYNIKVYKFIRDNGGWGNWDFVIIEKYPCNDKVEKGIRERYWIELMGTLNTEIPSRTKKEYYEKNKEKNKEHYKEYRDNNKDKAKEYQKEYRDNNKDKRKEYQKEYRDNNKDKAKEYKKEWYEKNKEKIKEYSKKNKTKEYERKKTRNKQPYTCLTCNKTITTGSKTYHNKSKKHLRNLEKST